VIDPTGGAATGGQSDLSNVWDGGVARPVLSKGVSNVVNNTTVTIIPAAPGLKTKVLGFHYMAITVTAAGSGVIWTGGGVLWVVSGPVVANVPVVIPPAGVVIFSTPVNTALGLNTDGNANLISNVVYYQAP